MTRQPITRALMKALAALACLASLNADATEKVRFMLDWAFQGPQAVFTYAADKGYFAEEGLDVTVDRGMGSADAVNKLASGAYDMAFGDINSMMEFNVKNPTMPSLWAVMMLYDVAPLCVVTMDAAIKTPKDLEGKKLVTSPGAADLRLFPIFARAAGVDVSKVSFMNVSPQLREPLLLKHEADASTAFYHTSYMTLKALGADVSKLKVFMYSDYGIQVYGNAIMTSRAFAEAKPEVVKAFNRAVARSMQDIVASPTVAIGSIKKRDGTVNEAVEAERLRIVTQTAVLTPYVRRNGFGGIDKARMEVAITQVTEALALPSTPKVDDVFNDKFLPPLPARTLNRNVAKTAD